MANSARAIVQAVLPRRMADDIWSAQYDKALPVTFNAFALSAVLPAVFYMFRFGHRRGRGKFLDTYGPNNGTIREQRRATTIERVAKRLATSSGFDGFDGIVERAILGDLLLGFSLENIRHDLGRDKQIQRAAPTHYMASWIDLPERAAHLRYVPEMIVAMLADQAGEHVEATNSEKTWFPVANNLEDNLLLNAFSLGIERTGLVGDHAADKFDEGCDDIGLDQLLMIRLAQLTGAAPEKSRGKEGAYISNQLPIAETAARDFSEDIRRFVRSYAAVIPRHALVDMLESSIATGMTTILTSVVKILFKWVDTGEIIEKGCQRPAGVFIDCSNGVNKHSRDLAEQSLDDLMRRIERLPEILMILRLLDYAARDNTKIKRQGIQTRPYATEWLSLLGDLLHKRHEESEFIHRQMDEHGSKLATELGENYPDAAETLRNKYSESNAIRRLAAGLTPLLGKMAQSSVFSMVDSTLNVERPNGLARKRQTTRGNQLAESGRKRRDVRSMVFTDSVLEYLVHLHLLRNGNKPGIQTLSLKDFLNKIRDRYGFHIDSAPKGMTISNDLLQSNRMVLERRLRDLGLLVGVNDAEAMKRLRPRFEPQMEG